MELRCKTKTFSKTSKARDFATRIGKEWLITVTETYKAGGGAYEATVWYWASEDEEKSEES
jgi:hypothetical protein